MGLVGKDMNKPDKPEVAEMGGLCIVFGFLIGILLFIGMVTFTGNVANFQIIFACLCTILMIAIIGMLDDILGWKIGLRMWQKPLLTIPAALPIMVINAGHSTMCLPFFGTIDWGIVYPLIIIPIGITVAANGYNMLAGYNGLETAMGIIILLTLGYFAFINNKMDAALLALCMVGALAAFLVFNWFPAKIFPGNTMTYAVGALIACVAIIGDLQKVAIILFIPYAVDFFLPLRKRFHVEAFAKPNKDYSLEMPYDSIYDTTHFAIAMLKRIKNKVYEQDVVAFICSIEIVIALCLIWFYK